MLLKGRYRSLRIKIIGWSFVPTTIILLAVALVTYYAYQRVTEDLVTGRNRELTRLSAGQLAADLSEYTGLLATLTRTAGISSSDPVLQRAALGAARNRLVIFDAGTVILDSHGTVVAAEPDRPDAQGRNWSDRDYFRQMLRSGGPVFSDVIADGPGGAEAIVVAVPIVGPQGEFRGTMAGMFRLGARAVSAFYGGIVKLRIGESGLTYLVDSRGRVIHHTDSDLIGVDLSARPVVQQALQRKVSELRTHDAGGHEIVASFAPVPGTPWGLVTEERWDTLMSPSQPYRQFLLLLLALGVVVPALVVHIGVAKITGPIARLIEAAQEVAGGSFGRTISVETGDELEELARQFNQMSAQLQESYAHLERKVADRTRELATLNAIAAVVSQSLELQQVLDSALDRTLQAMGAEAGGIYLLENEGALLDLVAYRGFDAPYAAAIDGLTVGEGFSGQVVQMGQPVVVKDIGLDPWLTRIAVGEDEHDALASVPLTSRGKVLGAMFVTASAPREFTTQEVQILSSIGNQVGVAVENARLFESAQRLAVMEERNRLARDLHDSVTQAMYSLTLYAEATARLLSAGQVEMAASHLKELRSTAQLALREMRSLIFELRPPLLEKEGLVGALQSRLESVEARAGLDTEFSVEGDLRLPAEIEEGLYRISQEALNNALKHAQPRRIKVRLRRDPSAIVLEIVDDGVGFDVAAARQSGGLGLSGMEERVARLGGTLVVESSEGGGTVVRVELGGTQGNSEELRGTRGNSGGPGGTSD